MTTGTDTATDTRRVRPRAGLLLALLAAAWVAGQPAAAHAAGDPDPRGRLPAIDTPPHVFVPAPGERVLPIPDSDKVRGVTARMALLLQRWTDEEGIAWMSLLDARVDDKETLVLTVQGRLAEIPDHDYELGLLAIHGTMHAAGTPVRTVRFILLRPDGLLLPESLVRPRLAPAPEPGEEGSAQKTEPPRSWTGAGALSGRRVAISPGHGWYWTGTGWLTQRSDSFGIVEDFITPVISWWHVDPYLRGAGATVVWLREPDFGEETPRLVDDGDSRYSEVAGTFSAGAAPATGFQGDYRTAPASTSPVARYGLAGTGAFSPISIRWSPGANRVDDARVVIRHLGGETTLPLDQRRGGANWLPLGRFPIDSTSTLELRANGTSDEYLIADGVRMGTMKGAFLRGGAASGKPPWQECSRNWAEYSGAGAAVHSARASDRDSDIVGRPLWANTLGVDAYVSIHTNAAGGTGTETYIFDGAATAGSAGLQTAVHNRMIEEIRAYWNPSWTDRRTKTANFGELRELTNAPGILVEVAFHDRDPNTGPDVPSLKDPRFRRIAGRAIARGVIRHFQPSAVFAPEPPLSVALRADAQGLVASWSNDTAREGAAAATSWRVQVARNGRNFDAGTPVEGTTWRVPDLDVGDVVAIRVIGVNAGGEGVPSQSVAAWWGGGPTTTLAVAAFDRWDAGIGEDGNTFDYLIEHGLALRAAHGGGPRLAFDGATDDALAGLVRLDAWDTVVWQAGEESTENETFSDAQQTAVRALVARGGRILASGAEIGWDLSARGTATDRAFLREVFGASYVADDSGTRNLAAGTGALSTVPALVLANATEGPYDVDFPDVLGADGGTVVHRWEGGQGAGVLGPTGRTLLFGFPIEGVLSTNGRGALLQASLELIGATTVDPTDPGDDDVGDTGIADAGVDVGVDDVGDTGPDDAAGEDAGDDVGDAAPTDDATADVLLPDTTQEDASDDIEGPDATPDVLPAPDADAPDAPTDAPVPDDSGIGRPDVRDDVGGLPPVDQRLVRVNDACGCSATPETGDVAWWSAVFALLFVRRRRARPKAGASSSPTGPA